MENGSKIMDGGFARLMMEDALDAMGLEDKPNMFTRLDNKYVAVRDVCMYLCRKGLGLRFNEVGEMFGKTHSTAIFGCRKVEGKRYNPLWATTYATVTENMLNTVGAINLMEENGDVTEDELRFKRNYEIIIETLGLDRKSYE